MRMIFMGTLLLWVFFTGCALKDGTDPLKNSKKLILKGHTSLYENGMLEIPFTKIHFIPALKSTQNLSYELFFEDGREALIKGLKDALHAFYIIPEGSKEAYVLSQKVYTKTKALSKSITDISRTGGVWLIDRSSKLAKNHIVDAFSHSYETGKKLYALGENIQSHLDINFIPKVYGSSKTFLNRSLKLARYINKKTNKLTREAFSFAAEEFVEGYIALPQKLKHNVSKIYSSVSDGAFTQAFKNAEDFRAEKSLYFQDIISNTVSSYTKDTGESLSKVGRNFSKHVEEEGFVLSSLKSMRWLLQGIFYDGLIKPLAKFTVGTLGFVSVNGLVYPVHILANETKASAEVMVEVTYLGLKSLYEFVAPTFNFALASLLGSSTYITGKVAATGTALVGTTAATIAVSGAAIATGASKTVGFIAGTSTKYIGVPLGVSTHALGEVSYGVLASSATALASATTFVAGEATSLVTDTVAVGASATTLVGGSALSVVNAASQGMYHLSKAAILPTGYALSSGAVLGYGSISQLQAHTLLAVTDAAYVVLSLEGPKWVIYALSGNGAKDTSLAVGSVINLQEAQKEAMTIQRLDVSPAIIDKVLNSLGKDLPRLK